MEPYSAIQVTADMTNARTQKREITALEQTMHRMSDVTGTIITLREGDTKGNCLKSKRQILQMYIYLLSI